MASSTNRKRDLDTLKGQAENLWDDQREILERANRVVRQASRQAGRQARGYAHDEVGPRARGAVSAGRGVVSGAREHLTDDVVPAVTTALGSALAILEAAKNPEVRAALKKAGSFGTAAATRAGIVKPKSSGIGKYILIGVGVVAVAGIAYAAWQTLRADDDLWIDDEELTEQTGDVQPS